MDRIENRTFDELKVGDTASLARTLTYKDIELFAIISGDVNPAHVDEAFAQSDMFHKIIAHGMWGGALISTVLGTQLPGPGSIYIGQSLRFRCPVGLGDTITVTVKVTEKNPEKHRVTLECQATNQRGEVVISGTAEVIAPTEKISRERVTLPEVKLLEKGRHYRKLIEAARGIEPLRTAVVHPVDAHSLLAAVEAAKANLIHPVLVGPEARIRAAAEQAQLDLMPYDIVSTEHSHAAAAEINLGASYSLTGLQYLPRQDGCSHGWINQYEIYVSTDGVNCGTPVASGTFNYGNLSTSCPGAGVPSALRVAFPATTGQYIQLQALSEINGNPWTSAAEIDVLGTLVAPAPATLSTVTLSAPIVIGGSSVQGTVTLTAMAPAGGAVVSLQSDTPLAATPASGSVTVPAGQNSATFTVNTFAVGAATTVHITGSYNSSNAQAALTVNPGTLISQTGWSASADSQQNISSGCTLAFPATNAVDGNPATIWHTQYCPTSAPLPHQITINLGASYSLTGLQYLPRQDGCSHGWINQYAIYVSTDGVDWGTPVASGTFNYGNLNTSCPGAGVPSALQVAFPATTGPQALSEINGNPWTSAAEINVVGTLIGLPTVSQVTLNAPIVIGGSSVQDTVTLTAMAPAGGAVVSLQSDTPLAATPASGSVTVPAGQNSATFTVNTFAVGAATTVHITGSYNSSNAQAALTVNPGTLISQTGWSASADSQQNISSGCTLAFPATNAVDGNPATIWHTQYCPTSAPLPHQITINLGASYSLTGLQYLPRQDGCANGRINQYAVYVSTDGVDWGTPVASGTFNYGNLSTSCPGAGVPSALQVAFPATTGQYIQLQALSEINGNPWTSAAEINVLGQ